jgi:hypothetical protein
MPLASLTQALGVMLPSARLARLRARRQILGVEIPVVEDATDQIEAASQHDVLSCQGQRGSAKKSMAS